ncbi:MAG: hypothetical protein ACR2LH_10870 [Thermoleophilaceae bacterium]
MTAPRRIVLLAYADCQALDLTGPMEVFAMARREDPARYSIEVVAPGGLPSPPTAACGWFPTGRRSRSASRSRRSSWWAAAA